MLKKKPRPPGYWSVKASLDNGKNDAGNTTACHHQRSARVSLKPENKKITLTNTYVWKFPNYCRASLADRRKPPGEPNWSAVTIQLFRSVPSREITNTLLTDAH